ncbi:MAG TPA: hypothetical protein VM783_01710, partial [Candidatus Acidoferrum sp.]|nr:hypothetical protein [Candidatus Acidoferrum sp.]
ENNLKDITVQIPVGSMTCVTGVSGSGKTSLVMDILYNAVAQRLHKSKNKAGQFDQLVGANLFDRVVGIDQAPIGRTPRSNPATYTGLFDHLRNLFAQLPEARVRGYGQPGFLSTRRAGAVRFVQARGLCEWICIFSRRCTLPVRVVKAGVTTGRR